MEFRQLPYAHYRCMRVSVVAVPHWCIAGSSVVANAFHDHLDSRGGIGDENKIELIRIGTKESKRPFPYLIHAMSGKR